MDEPVDVSQPHPPPCLQKCPTGIVGLDQITRGGLPRGRTTLVCGGPGSGKTLLGIEVLAKGALDQGEPGVLMCFEEDVQEVTRNAASLDVDLQSLVEAKHLFIDHVQVSPDAMREVGDYDLQGLFIRLGYAIDSVGAKRVVLDTIDVLFGALANLGILRTELQRLFAWLKEKGVTTLVTAERGDGILTRHGLEEYVSDCVILLDHRVADQVATRRLRVVKYRGSAHGTNEYPFLLDDQGFTVMPLTAVRMDYAASSERVSTGIGELDAMLGGAGYYRGGTLLVSGAAGAGKTSMAASFVDAACRRGERCVFFAFEESPDQIVRNMRSIGVDLGQWIDQGLLHLLPSRATSYGLEMHLARMSRAIEQFRPGTVVLDPISALTAAGAFFDNRSTLARLVDYFKSAGVTAFLTCLNHGGESLEQTDVRISSLIDAWLLLRNLEQDGERTRLLSIAKARGIAHSNQVREFVLSAEGIRLLDVYVGPSGILTGSRRLAQALRDEAATASHRRETEHRRALVEHKRKALQAKIAALEEAFALELWEEQEALSAYETKTLDQLEERAEAGRQRQESAVTQVRKPPGDRDAG